MVQVIPVWNGAIIDNQFNLLVGFQVHWIIVITHQHLVVSIAHDAVGDMEDPAIILAKIAKVQDADATKCTPIMATVLLVVK